jgi:hypothetical protein
LAHRGFPGPAVNRKASNRQRSSTTNLSHSEPIPSTASAGVAELVDAADLGSAASRHPGSSPGSRIVRRFRGIRSAQAGSVTQHDRSAEAIGWYGRLHSDVGAALPTLLARRAAGHADRRLRHPASMQRVWRAPAPESGRLLRLLLPRNGPLPSRPAGRTRKLLQPLPLNVAGALAPCAQRSVGISSSGSL